MIDMKIVFEVFLIFIVTFICWIFATATLVNGEHNRTAFIIKSIFYWFAVIGAFISGLIFKS